MPPDVSPHQAHFCANPTAAKGGKHGHKDTEMNAPDRFELFLLADGEKKITEATDTRTPNTSIFTINKEDHTLGNMVRAQLIQNPHVNFAGYKIPHPLFATFELRVQTDGELSPKDALVAACKGLVGDLETLSREFTKEYELRKMVSGDGADK
ncbi:DNA-directed RNA polymerase II subunit RPB11 [Hyphodiscus hymeniophilus]|uniref:DNA-directed RNA polymerase II subunit RPB11 n=1 Tax=Hyphodiscus hymeniophilus TaxID=353542 RepID=A0A9P6SPG6_9HELO|nr:DNA-directed RNA polymerase II subunit RPB11 [Hyphodiscus hymeniophilus]